ncbi:MAG: TOMM precursor leader peptide-binding protein [Nocardioides sp.]
MQLCHAEGDRWYIGPFADADERPRYRDLRARRLAAAPFPELLRASWAALSEPSAPAPPMLTAAGAAVVAGLMASDILAFAASQAVPGRGFLTAVDPRTSRVCRHPVLPAPEPLSSLQERMSAEVA